MITIAAICYLETEIKRELELYKQNIPEHLMVKFIKVNSLNDGDSLRFDGIIIHHLAFNRNPNYIEIVKHISKYNS